MITRTYSLFLTVVFLLSAIAVPLLVGPRVKSKAQMPTQAQAASGNGQSQIDAPIAEFNPPQEKDSRKEAKRLRKNKRHNLRDANLSPEIRAALVLSEDKPVRIRRPANTPPPQAAPPAKTKHESTPLVIGAAPNDDSPVEPALPTYNSDAVVIGNIESSSAFLSEDKTGVYSEFALQISQVLKNPPGDLDPGALTTVLRPGGGVRFPSGNVKYFLIGGRGMPHVGGRYLLFLKYDNLAEAFYIVTGYELVNGKVFPLDSIPSYGTEDHPFAVYQKYKDVEESKFLTEVSDAILHPVLPHGGFVISAGTPERR
jgi:hypothetical protein